MSAPVGDPCEGSQCVRGGDARQDAEVNQDAVLGALGGRAGGRRAVGLENRRLRIGFDVADGKRRRPSGCNVPVGEAVVGGVAALGLPGHGRRLGDEFMGRVGLLDIDVELTDRVGRFEGIAEAFGLAGGLEGVVVQFGEEARRGQGDFQAVRGVAGDDAVRMQEEFSQFGDHAGADELRVFGDGQDEARREGSARRQFAPYDEQHAGVVVFRPDGKLQAGDAQISRRLGSRRFDAGLRGRRRLRLGQRLHVGDRAANVRIAQLTAKARHGVRQSHRGAAGLDNDEQVLRRAALHGGWVGEVARRRWQHARQASAAPVRAVAVDAQALVDCLAGSSVRLRPSDGDGAEKQNCSEQVQQLQWMRPGMSVAGESGGIQRGCLEQTFSEQA